jgi:hypothetical protein
MATQFFTAFCTAPRLVNEDLVHTSFSFDSLSSSVRVFFRRAVSYSLASAVGVLLVTTVLTAFADAQTAEKIAPQDAKQDMKQPGSSQLAETEKNAAQIELLETKYRFETNGDSRKEVHTRVRINNELGVRQFARLNFDFNRSFQAVEIPLVRITHPSGGTADILPSAITDNPNPAVVDAPAYQDVRVKSVRILGLQPGDLLEYRVITTTAHHPLAPDFWCEHSFDRAGIVTEEMFELDLPASRPVQMRINPETPASSKEKSGDRDSARVIYRWNRIDKGQADQSPATDNADIVLTTYESWLKLSAQLSGLIEPSSEPSQTIGTKAVELTKGLPTSKAKLEVLYEFVSRKIRTVDLPIGATAFRNRPPDEILQTGYGIAEDKFTLLASLASSLDFEARIALFAAGSHVSDQLPSPSLFANSATIVHIPMQPTDLGHGGFKMCDRCGDLYWLVPAMEVAPFAAIPATLRGREAFVVNYMLATRPFAKTPEDLPFPAVQRVTVDASISSDGALDTKLKYILRGDNELLLRVAFHKTPKEKWKEVAQLLAISDGFRGQITNVAASDPYATKQPFTVEYEITQAKFIDWSKKPVRIPALLPSPGLPDPTSSSHDSSSKKSIDLGTPLEIDLDATVTLPEGTTVQAPTGTSVERDYAIFSSKYSAQGNTVHATRKLHFISREISATRAGDLNAFLHAVQADQTQLFTLQRSNSAAK